jgi:hypothetical protein
MAIPSTGTNFVQTVGNFNAAFSHPLVLAGAAINLKGFKLEDVFIHTDQLMDNSKMIPLVDGGTVTITNSVLAGRITINALRVGNPQSGGFSGQTFSDLSGDFILISNFLQALGDNVGGTLTLSWGVGISGQQATAKISFNTVTVARCPPAIIAGNDLPVYPIVLNYASFMRY